MRIALISKILSGSILLIISLLFLPAICLSQPKFEIDGKINGIQNGTALVQNYDEAAGKVTVTDSVKIIDGIFKLKGHVAFPQMMLIIMQPGTWSFEVFVENSKIHLDIDTAGAEHYDFTKIGYGKRSTITKYTEYGSKNYDLYQQFQQSPAYVAYLAKLTQLTKSLNNKAISATDEIRIRAESDSVYKELSDWEKRRISILADQSPSSVAVVYLFYQLWGERKEDIDYAYMDAMLKKFTGEARTNDYFRKLAKYEESLALFQPGKPAPDFTLRQKDSTSLALSSLRGKFLLIDFWASWCVPCRQAIPHWKAVYKQYHDQEFDMLSVSTDNNRQNWIKAMAAEGMDWRQVIDEFPHSAHTWGTVDQLYAISSIPFYILLDKEGKILLRSQSEEDVDAQLAKLFKH